MVPVWPFHLRGVDALFLGPEIPLMSRHPRPGLVVGIAGSEAIAVRLCSYRLIRPCLAKDCACVEGPAIAIFGASTYRGGVLVAGAVNSQCIKVSAFKLSIPS